VNRYSNKLIRVIPVLLCLTGILFSCVNDLETIQKITFNTNAPDESTKDLHIIISDSGYAKVEILAALAETYRDKQYITKVKDSLRVNFFNDKGKIVSTLFALSGEINFTNGTIIVKDSVRLYNFKNKQLLETEALFWNQRDSTIYSLSQIIVRSPKGIVIGKDGLKNNGYNGPSEDMMKEFMKNMFGMGQPEQEEVPDIECSEELSLEELYTGKVFNKKIERYSLLNILEHLSSIISCESAIVFDIKND
jgi:LPS export ABC transporter protein LptC